MTIDLDQYGDGDELDAAVLTALADADAGGTAFVDEFHCRARQATGELAAHAGLHPGMRVLDVGSGLGGPARHLASAFGVHVTGIEIVAPYVRIARLLTRRAKLDDVVVFERGNALSAPFASGTFDCAWLQHVLANITDKARLFAELRRIVVTDGVLAMHEIVAPDGHQLKYPLPWAKSPSTSYVPRPERLRTALESAGFRLHLWKDTTPLARAWCRSLTTRVRASLPRPGQRSLRGSSALEALGNLADNLDAGRLGVAIAVFINAPAGEPVTRAHAPAVRATLDILSSN